MKEEDSFVRGEAYCEDCEIEIASKVMKEKEFEELKTPWIQCLRCKQLILFVKKKIPHRRTR